jgi:hypothetical protein
MADKDFGLKLEDLESLGMNDPEKYTIPNLKNATYQQLKNLMIITDYVFCTLL